MEVTETEWVGWGRVDVIALILVTRDRQTSKRGEQTMIFKFQNVCLVDSNKSLQINGQPNSRTLVHLPVPTCHCPAQTAEPGQTSGLVQLDTCDVR